MDRTAELIGEALENGMLSSGPAQPANCPSAAPPAPSEEVALKHAIVWFHHIKSPKKRKCMADWSHELRCGGFWKVGYPGVLIVEGLASDVDEYLTRLRAQRWKAMAIRGERVSPAKSVAAAHDARSFGSRMVELGEKELGLLGEHCRAAGLEDLFLAAMKLDKGDA